MFKKLVNKISPKKNARGHSGGQGKKLSKYVDLLVVDYGEALKSLSKQ